MRTSKNNKGWLHSHLYQLDSEDEKGKQRNLKKEQKVLENIHNKAKTILLFGPKNTGKTFLVDDLLEKQENILFIDSTEINSLHDFKTALRAAQNVILYEETTVIEGEIINLSMNSITLKTDEMESIFTLREQINLEVGDIVQIIDGEVQKIGTRLEKENIDVETKILPMPKGDLIQKRTVSKKVKLSELDTVQSGRFFIDRKLTEWIDRNKAKILDSTLVIDNAHLLTDKIHNYIATLKDIPHTPFCILISRENLKIRNVVKIAASSLTDQQLSEIIKKRIFFENITFNAEIMDKIENICKTNGLKYAMNLFFLLSTHSHAEQKNITLKDLEMLTSLYKNIDQLD